jgi:hypothetical protein
MDRKRVPANFVHRRRAIAIFWSPIDVAIRKHDFKMYDMLKAVDKKVSAFAHKSQYL